MPNMFSYSPNIWLVLVSAVVWLVVVKIWLKISYPQTILGRKVIALLVVAALVQAYVLAHFVYYVGALTIGQGMQAGFWLWLGFVAPTLSVVALTKGQTWKAYLIDILFPLIALIVMAGILANW